MAEGIWTLNDDGEFTLDEPYATLLMQARLEATNGWATALIMYLANHSPYTPDELKEALLERNARGEDPNETMDAFVLEAITGDL